MQGKLLYIYIIQCQCGVDFSALSISLVDSLKDDAATISFVI